MKIFNIRKVLAARPRKRDQIDTTPIAIPVGASQPEDIHSMMKRFIREELHRHAMVDQAGEENGTFEEEDDFEIDAGEMDDLPDLSRYQLSLMTKDDTPPLEAPQEAATLPAGVSGPAPTNKPPLKAPESTQDGGLEMVATPGTT